MASGIIEANRTGGHGQAAALRLGGSRRRDGRQPGRAGFTGPPTALEGRFGFFEAFLHGTVDLDEVTRDLGEEWAVPGIFFKPYPANHFTHTGLDAARRLRERASTPTRSRKPCSVSPSTVRTIGEPLEVKRRPETGYQAQFSGPYMVALGLLGGGGWARASTTSTTSWPRPATA
jgi:2-methylcitrate dehydratase PrpD